MRRCLCRIRQYHTAVFVYHPDQFFCRGRPSKHIRDKCQRGKLCVRCDGITDFLLRKTAVRFTLQIFKRGSDSSGRHLPRKQVAVMLHDRDKNLIPRL